MRDIDRLFQIVEGMRGQDPVILIAENGLATNRPATELPGLLALALLGVCGEDEAKAIAELAKGITQWRRILKEHPELLESGMIQEKKH
jgi:hypothetical protein